jgi:hypothetical protein
LTDRDTLVTHADSVVPVAQPPNGTVHNNKEQAVLLNVTGTYHGVWADDQTDYGPLQKAIAGKLFTARKGKILIELEAFSPPKVSTELGFSMVRGDLLIFDGPFSSERSLHLQVQGIYAHELSRVDLVASSSGSKTISLKVPSSDASNSSLSFDQLRKAEGTKGAATPARSAVDIFGTRRSRGLNHWRDLHKECVFEGHLQLQLAPPSSSSPIHALEPTLINPAERIEAIEEDADGKRTKRVHVQRMLVGKMVQRHQP